MIPRDTIKKLDQCYHDAEKVLLSGKSIGVQLSGKIKKRIDAWQFGAYGWTSPVNLLITAAWVKWIEPSQDVCKIWSVDDKGDTIKGGFSIRSMDETYTIPFITKFQLHERFCSPNSGMQGSRALEKNKLRASSGRIDRKSDLGQKVKFDIELFKNILNDIDDSSPTRASNIFKYFIEKAILIKKTIAKEKSTIPTANKLKDSVKVKDIVFSAVDSIRDPQFVKVVVAALLEIMVHELPILAGCTVGGLEGSQTAADAQAKTPGDLWISDEAGKVIAGCEVKDSSKTIGFDVLSGIQTRVTNNPTMSRYIFVSSATEVVALEDRSDPQWVKILRSYESQGVIIIAINLEELFNLISFIAKIDHNLINLISKTLKVAKDLKANTLNAWSKIITATQTKAHLKRS